MLGQKEAWRIFIAVPIPQEVKQKMQAWCNERGEQLQFRKWVCTEDYHITVQFLGDVMPERLEQLEVGLKQAIENTHKFSLEAAGCGTFGRPASPSVLWAGVRGDVAALGRLQQKVTEANRALGFVPEERRYTPHITLARKYREDARLNPEVLKSASEFGSWSVDRLVVYRTHMHERPMYEVVRTITL